MISRFRKTRHLLHVFILLLFICQIADGRISYDAFSPSEKVHGIVLNPYSIEPSQKKAEEECIIAYDGNKRMTITIRNPSDEDSTLILNHPDYGSITWSLGNGRYYPHFRSIYCACLNEDDSPDVIIEFDSPANGLAGERSDIIFLLSHKSGYTAVATETYGFGPQNFVDYHNDGKVQFLHTSIPEAECSDGRPHRFWLYQLLNFKGRKLVEDDSFSPRFIQYTFESNHLETKLLSMKKKQEILETTKSDLQGKELVILP